MYEDHSRKRAFWMLAIMVVAIIAGAALMVHLQKADAAEPERAAFGGLSDLAYSTAVGTRLALGGEIKGCGRGDLAATGGNKYMRWMDVSKMRVYFKDPIIGKGRFVICDGVIDAKGRMRLKRITIIVDDPAK